MKLHKDLIELIEFQINEIDRLFEEYNFFFQSMNYEEPDLTQVTVMGSIIHSFYTGVENIFDKISKNIDNVIPVGTKTHQELLDNMYSKNDGRGAIITEETYLLLNEYMKFRHVYRHGYSFHLKWGKMKPLADNLFITWEKVKQQIKSFINS